MRRFAFLLLALCACGGITPSPDVAKICGSAACAGPMAHIAIWRDANEDVALYVYDGDIRSCSHPPRIWFDKHGNQLASVGSNPVPAGGVAEGPQIQMRLTAGLHETESVSCPAQK